MSDARNSRVRALFDALQDLPTDLGLLGQRAWLEQQCGGDSSLFDEVWQLHSAAAADDPRFLAPPLLLTRPEDLIGHDLHEYRLDSVLGIGGMGVVYRAHARRAQTAVAVKVLHPRFLANGDCRRRFQQEIALASKLQHPNIVKVLTAGEDGGLLWFAMDLISGWSLAELLQTVRAGRPLPTSAPNITLPSVSATLIRELAEALAHAHAAGILHRDIKPANILIDRAGRAHLADFGLAKLIDSDTATMSGLIAGTFAYMSPEQARQLKSAVTAHSDVYSAGAVLYELLSGSPPFGFGGTPAILRQIAEQEVPPISRTAEAQTRGLALCAEQALRLDPADRYPSAHALAEDISRWIAGKPVSAHALSMLSRIRSRTHSRRFVLGAASAAVGATVVGSGLAVWIADRRRARHASGFVTVNGAYMPAGSTLGYAVYGYDTSTPLASIRPVSLSRGLQTLTVPPGLLRLQVRIPGVAVQELDRIVLPGSAVTVAPVVPAQLPTTLSFIAVAGGIHHTQQSTPVEAPAASLAPYELSTRPVSNAEFEQFLRESGRSRDARVAERRAALMPTQGVDGWAALPATGLDLALARAAAEWWGCRLPTRAEWEFAAERHALSGTPATGPSLPLGHDSTAPAPDGSKSTFLAYLAYACTPRANAGIASAHMYLSNITEWTISPVYHTTAYRVTMTPEMVHICGVNWHSTVTTVGLETLTNPRTTYTTMPSGDLGFRLARTITT